MENKEKRRPSSADSAQLGSVQARLSSGSARLRLGSAQFGSGSAQLRLVSRVPPALLSSPDGVIHNL